MDPQPKPIEISAKRPTLQITLPDGSVQQWQYDVVVLKMKIQELQDKHNVPKVPSEAALGEFCEYLLSLGMPACNVDVALRVWSLVIVQFQQMAIQIASQIEAVCR